MGQRLPAAGKGAGCQGMEFRVIIIKTGGLALTKIGLKKTLRGEKKS